MTASKKIVLLAGWTLVALVLLFPPWDYFDADTSGRRSAGYHFFLSPPQPLPAGEVFRYSRYPHMVHVRINDLRFILELAVVVPAMLGLTIAFYPRRSRLVTAAAVLFFSITLLTVGFIIWEIITVKMAGGRWEFP